MELAPAPELSLVAAASRSNSTSLLGGGWDHRGGLGGEAGMAVSTWLTIHAIELTNLYVCLVLWAVSGIHFRMFRKLSALIITSCLSLPSFISALFHLSCGHISDVAETQLPEYSSCLYWATWVCVPVVSRLDYFLRFSPLT